MYTEGYRRERWMIPTPHGRVFTKERIMFRPISVRIRAGFQVVLVLALLAGLLGVSVQPAQAAVPIPIFSITAVEKDSTVTIKTTNFPANKFFTARMGLIGTKAIGGIIVGTFNSGAGGTLTLTFDIPAALKGLARIAIRTDASTGGYYSYNWFWNNTASGSVTPYYGIPTFSITSVVKDTSVAVKTSNFPSGRIFTVRIGAYGTKGIGGIVVGTLDSGAGGILTAEFAIPASLAGSARLAIRMDASGGFYSYNWFWNDPAAAPKPYVGIPTFSIVGVIKDSMVAIKTNNYPPNRVFTVRMGLIGTRGIGGIVVGSFNSGPGGVMTIAFDIPDALKGQSRIAIRADASGGFYSYNWFWNNTYP